MKRLMVFFLLAACGGGAPGVPVGDPLFEQAQVGPAGGTVAVGDVGSPFFGTAIEIPAGALDRVVPISIRRVLDGGLTPQFLVFEIGPEELEFARPVVVTIRYDLSLLAAYAIAGAGSLLVVRSDPGGGVELLEQVASDPSARTVSARTSRLGRFVVEASSTGLPLDMHRAFFQPRVLDSELMQVSGRGVTMGGTLVGVGKGSRAAFFAGTGSNLVLVHGLLGDGTGFMGATDLVEALGPFFDNILVYQYPTGRGVKEAANWLFNELVGNAEGFSTVLYGHSMGGVVARYCLERSAGDPDRAALANFSVSSGGSLSGLVTDLVTTGSPHRGAAIIDLAALLLSGSEDAVGLALSIRGLADLQEGEGGVAGRLNPGFVRPAGIGYFLIAGRLCFGICLQSDGLVKVSSATGNPELTSQVTTRVFDDVPHGDLHNLAAVNGVADYILGALNKR